MKLVWDSKVTAERHEGGYVRERSNQLYHSARWTKLSRQFRADHPLCAECLRKGIATPSEVTDHIIPFPICKDFYDLSNLQALCKKCNTVKGNRDKKQIESWRIKQQNQRGL